MDTMPRIPGSTMLQNDSLRHFEAIFSHAAIGILVTNDRGRIVEVNPFVLTEFGYTEKEISSMKLEELLAPPFGEKICGYREKLVKEKKARFMGSCLHAYAVKRDGSSFPVEVSLGNYASGGRHYVVAFINRVPATAFSAKKEVVENDLEDKVKRLTGQLEQTLGQVELTNLRLEESILFQKTLVDNARAMIIVTDEKGIIRVFNKEASLNIGYSPEEVIGKHTPVLFHDKAEIEQKRAVLFRLSGNWLDDDFKVLVEKPGKEVHHEEYSYVRKDGTIFPVQLSITPVMEAEGDVSGYMGIGIDISERKKAEKDLQEALEKEKELGELKSRFVSIASHEFRTPLSTVLSSAYLVEKYAAGEDQPKREKHLQRIVSAVSTLTDILNDFLSVGKIEEGKIQVRIAELDIHKLVTESMDEMKGTLKKNQKIYYDHRGPQEVMMDASLLKHIIANLVSNASKFSPDTGAIEIRTLVTDGRMTLSVKDHGIGISREDQKHLMERFFRAANASSIQGTGLGLHIVSKYAELMNGKVKCLSELGKGTEFIITFYPKT